MTESMQIDGYAELARRRRLREQAHATCKQLDEARSEVQALLGQSSLTGAGTTVDTSMAAAVVTLCADTRESGRRLQAAREAETVLRDELVAARAARAKLKQKLIIAAAVAAAVALVVVWIWLKAH